VNKDHLLERNLKEMKNNLLVLTLLLSALLLSACAGSTAAAFEAANPEDAAGAAEPAALDSVPAAVGEPASPPASLEDDYPDALSLRSQLIVGTFRLEGTPQEVTPEQAAELLPLWQLLRLLSGTDTSNQLETEAVMDQIQATMTYEQLLAIQEMRLTNADNQALMQELGISGQGSEAGSPGSGQGKNMTEAEKEARRAERGITGSQAGSGGARATLDKLIELLEGK
jgi:hypothetical protein